MLEVKVILHDANTGEVREIARLQIANDGTGDRNYGNYVIEAESDIGPGLRGRFAFKGVVKEHDRHDGVWKLVGKAIKSLKP